jgi:hypothetical protein
MSFPIKHPAERIPMGTDWPDDLDTGETVVSATVTMRVIRNRDANVAAMLEGSPMVASPIVSQWIVNGVAGVVYESIWRVVTSLPQTLEKRVRLLVI